ncbi:MAG: alkaline phosphatase family protein [Candidatus Sumerlaeia bacterium]|nr:alkaline phosphatase family protein [Candidatus Sumerlaeia bacterium]
MHNESGERRRVLMIGLDGATWDVIRPMIAAGRLPTLSRLVREGVSGVLRSTMPPLSPVAWSSFLTGVNPGRHGVFGFEEPVEGTYDFHPVTSRPAGRRSLWRIVSDHGRRVVALDIPFSWPPEPVNGCLVAGFGAPVGEGVEFTHPPALRRALEKRFGEFRVAVPNIKAAPPREAVFRRWDRILDNRARVADALIAEEDWDVFMIVLGVTDHIQHGAWTCFEPLHPDWRLPEAGQVREALFRYYARADEWVERLIERAGPSIHVLVLSDHGFGTTQRGDLTRQVLIEHGWLRYRPWPLLSGRRAMDWLHRAYHASPWLKRLLHRRRAGRRWLKQAVARAIDWPQTRAFPAAMGWQVYIHRCGAFPHGCVESDGDYALLCSQIREAIEHCPADGLPQRPIRRVWHRDEIYRGEAAARAPDLFVEYQNLHTPGSGTTPPLPLGAVRDLVGSHTLDGILIAWGPDIAHASLDGAHIEDVMPTALHLMGLPVPDDLDGRVLERALRPESLQRRPVCYESGTGDVVSSTAASLAADAAESVREQLRNLGYLD